MLSRGREFNSRFPPLFIPFTRLLDTVQQHFQGPEGESPDSNKGAQLTAGDTLKATTANISFKGLEFLQHFSQNKLEMKTYRCDLSLDLSGHDVKEPILKASHTKINTAQMASYLLYF